MNHEVPAGTMPTLETERLVLRPLSADKEDHRSGPDGHGRGGGGDETRSFLPLELYRLLMDKDLKEHGVRLEAMNDTGNRIGDGVQDDFAEWEREQITERTTAGRREKARQGKILAGRLPDYGFRFGPERDRYEVVEEEMAVVRRIFSELASGASVNGVCAALDADGVLPPAKGRKWQRSFVRDCAFDDVYAPHAVGELEALGVSPAVLGKLDATRPYGVWWYNRRESRAVRVPLGGGRYRKGKRIREKPKAEWIPVPVPASGVPREAVERARGRLEGQAKCSNSQLRFWELSGGLLRCPDCGRSLVAVSAWKTGSWPAWRCYRYVTLQAANDQLPNPRLIFWVSGSKLTSDFFCFEARLYNASMKYKSVQT